VHIEASSRPLGHLKETIHLEAFNAFKKIAQAIDASWHISYTHAIIRLLSVV
jgi:hypothetical protein